MLQLFGTDGIRSIAGKYPLDKETIKKIGDYSAIVLRQQFKFSRIVIGWDTRESSNWISDILIDSFCKAGIHILVAGIFPTPGVAFLSRQHSMIGIVVSASHNPYAYNGIKFFSPQGTKLDDSIEKLIEKEIYENKEVLDSLKGAKSEDFSQQAEEEYVTFLQNSWKPESFTNPFIIDCANGSTSYVAEKIFTKLFPQCHIINNTPNGKNINDHCGALCPEELAGILPSNTFGITFDGDGDRVILIDEDKNVRDGDYILGILATDSLEQNTLQNNLVVPTVMSNLGLLRYLEKKGVHTILAPVGDKNVYAVMVKKSSVLGGEQSGHIILTEHLPTGDGMLVALQILACLQRKGITLKQACSLFEKYPQVLLNIKTRQKPPLETVFQKDVLEGLEKEIDGRILIRYSGTEPLVRIMVEGKEKEKIEKVSEELKQYFISYLSQ